MVTRGALIHADNQGISERKIIFQRFAVKFVLRIPMPDSPQASCAFLHWTQSPSSSGREHEYMCERAKRDADADADAERFLGPRSPQRTLFDDADFDCCVIGIGRLGLCFALTLERAGLRVVGVDVNDAYVMIINEKTLDRFDETGHRVLRQTSTSAHVDRAEEGFSLERNVLVERRN